eukprot:m.202763 g.202763  ORF g.202763 m.202763 type:complete len:702 (+) comp14979_c0_seq1:110-2215(+)
MAYAQRIQLPESMDAGEASILTTAMVERRGPSYLVTLPGDEVVLSKRKALDLVCVVDVSGSMSSEATVQDSQGNVESHGHSYLDVVKHAVNTVITSLSPADRLTLVTFASGAKVVLPPTQMTASNKTTAKDVLDRISTGGVTQMFSGIATGMKALQAAPTHPNSNASMLLFTDGVPTDKTTAVEYVEALSQFRDPNGRLPCTIETFGFGYNLMSSILIALAEAGNGHYAFIPDSGLVGTVFVHALANLLSAACTGAHLVFEGTNTDADGKPYTYTEQLHSLHEGQTRTRLVNLPANLGEAASVSLMAYDPATQSTVQLQQVELSSEESDIASLTADNRAAVLTDIAIDLIQGLVDEANAKRLADSHRPSSTLASATEDDISENLSTKLMQLCDELEDACEDHEPTQTLLEDLQGQVSMGLVRPDFFCRWGRHYIPSLLAAHRGKYCNNFKDPGIQGFGGPLFASLRDEIDEAFLKLRMPKPSITRAGMPRTAACVSSAAYHTTCGGCFTGDSIVKMADGTTKLANEIVPGDVVAVPHTDDDKLDAGATTATVRMCVKIVAADGAMDVSELSPTLRLTPFHPVFVDGEWQFPCTLSKPFKLQCDAVYDFVLDQGHAMIIGGVKCVTLGHNKTSNSVVQHAFFGTEAVVHALSQHPSYNNGFVEVASSDFGRTPSLADGTTSSSHCHCRGAPPRITSLQPQTA